jgi:ribosomal protein L12E/L44/L45/RPP1/RPP2
MAYTVPTAADLKAIYPAFAAVADATITLWIDRVNGRDVDESWSEADFAPAIEAAAAHRMVRAGVAITGSATTSYAAAGVVGLKSGSFDVSFSPEAVKIASAGGWESTSYGLDYLELLRRRGVGMGVTNVGRGCA